MAKSLKITPPKALIPLMQAFHVDSEKVAKALISEVINAISFDDNTLTKNKSSQEEIDAIISLMRGIKPRDTIETLYAAQIIASHILGMRKLSSCYADDQRLGLKMLQFCKESMGQLEKKRNGGTQNISVTYNYRNKGNALSQTVIPSKELNHAS
jgi:hypothetical protein